MSQPLGRLVERQIQKALAEGKLQGLEGAGKPLPDRSGEAFTDMATAVAIRIMAEAGALPEEFKIKKLLDAAKENYRNAGKRRRKACRDGADCGVGSALQYRRRS